jgi:hypothetical protein
MPQQTPDDDDAMVAALDTLFSLDDAKRRPYLTLPGESLLLTAHARDLVTRAEKFMIDGGLDAEHVYSGAIVSVPLPRPILDAGEPDESGETESVIVWPGTVPTMLWHPLAWLPEHIAFPMTLQADGEDEFEEDEDSWAMRVALEMTMTGLYDQDTGWVDVLALNGIDIDSPADIARVQAWLDGGQDGVLDAINLEDYFAAAETIFGFGFSVARVHEILPAYMTASWSVVARTLMEDLVEGRVGANDPATDAGNVFAIANLAAAHMMEAPQDDATGEDAPVDALADIIEHVEAGPGQYVTDPGTVAVAVERLRKVLTDVANLYRTDESELVRAEQQAITEFQEAAIAGAAAGTAPTITTNAPAGAGTTTAPSVASEGTHSA